MKTLKPLTAALCLMALACGKPDPQPPLGNNPQFGLKGILISVDSLKFTAGVGGQYMYPACRRVEYNGSDSIYQYEATLAPAAGKSLPPSISILMADSDITLSSAPSFASSYLTSRTYPLLNPGLRRGGVAISYTDSTGKVYLSSKSASQPMASHFSIISISEGPVIDGLKTKKILVHFSCRCYFTGADFSDLKNMEGMVLLGYK